MRFLYSNHFQNAHQSLKSSRVRSALTMLGIAIGIASITAILSLSGGASKIIGSQVEALGGNIAVIRPGTVNKSIIDINQVQTNNRYTASTITETDVKSIQSIPHIKYVAPLMILGGSIKADSLAPSDSFVVATTPQLMDIAGLELGQGQFLDNKSKQNAVVIGAQLSAKIFDTELSIGRTVSIHGQPFLVIGVLKMIDNPINYNSINFDNSIIISYEAGKELSQNASQIQQIDIMADSVSNLKQAVNKIDEVLIKNHTKERDFSIFTGDQISQPTGQIFYTIAAVTTAIATISLVVGGIGIMNIMLVTVAERTREIGIRKALGASNSDIMWQFLIESLALSIGGGIAGYIGGYILAFGVSLSLPFYPAVNWQIAAAAIAISIIIGTIFGIYPAIKASRKDPIESLHQYN